MPYMMCEEAGCFEMSQKTKDYAADSAVMQTYGRAEIGFERGDGCWLISETGDRYLDCASGIAVNTLGHSHPRLVAARGVHFGGVRRLLGLQSR